MAKVLIPLGDGFEDLEAISVIDVLRRVGVEVSLASLKKDLVVTSDSGIPMQAKISIEEADSKEYEGVVLPGGFGGVQNMIASNSLTQFVKDMQQSNKVVAAICAAPLALFKMGVLKEAKFTCYPSVETMIENPNYVCENVVQEGNIITSRGPATALEFAFYLAEIFVGKEKTLEIKKGMLAC
ncbi:DJ-1 family glyoxalase III [Helicobacter burdigaliensis]|uniref:DJ-1 family glyoxalase III n=1 Tax=Helicobacter burdigaliensis TaxID=2315334 RepID=UPI000EF6CAF5|nr:DJ-1 family glyoxalase III [Helicobacter burdigaliensis]